MSDTTTAIVIGSSLVIIACCGLQWLLGPVLRWRQRRYVRKLYPDATDAECDRIIDEILTKYGRK